MVNTIYDPEEEEQVEKTTLKSEKPKAKKTVKESAVPAG